MAAAMYRVTGAYFSFDASAVFLSNSAFLRVFES
jgi:hypothetical protein